MSAAIATPMGDPSPIPPSVTAADGQRFTGAVISGTDLLVVTVERTGDRLGLSLGASACLILQGRQQRALIELHRELDSFIKDAQIDKVLLRGAPARGQYARGPVGSKIEALLQLITPVEIVHPNSVTAWIRRHGHLAPSPIPGLRTLEISLHEEAIATACLAEARSHDIAILVDEGT